MRLCGTQSRSAPCKEGNFLVLPGLDLRPVGSEAGRQLLYRLGHRGVVHFATCAQLEVSVAAGYGLSRLVWRSYAALAGTALSVRSLSSGSEATACQ
jgi:membrane-bound metal-dependent hydrolase YbcI (DUF457 family)